MGFYYGTQTTILTIWEELRGITPLNATVSTLTHEKCSCFLFNSKTEADSEVIKDTLIQIQSD